MNPLSYVAVAAIVVSATAPGFALTRDGNMIDEVATLKQLYARFNARDIDGVVPMLSDDVVWANGMDGGYVRGHQGVRDYWTRQWAIVSPHVEPLRFERSADGTIVVEVEQTIRDHQGRIAEARGLKDKTVAHVFRFANGKVTRFDIRSER